MLDTQGQRTKTVETYLLPYPFGYRRNFIDIDHPLPDQ